VDNGYVRGRRILIGKKRTYKSGGGRETKRGQGPGTRWEKATEPRRGCRADLGVGGRRDIISERKGLGIRNKKNAGERGESTGYERKAVTLKRLDRGGRRKNTQAQWARIETKRPFPTNDVELGTGESGERKKEVGDQEQRSPRVDSWTRCKQKN